LFLFVPAGRIYSSWLDLGRVEAEQRLWPESARFRTMNEHTPDSGRIPSLEEIELEVEVEAREFARRRLQERLQELADTHGGVFPPGRSPPAKARTTSAQAARPVRRD
jgi:hypothetical protein